MMKVNLKDLYSATEINSQTQRYKQLASNFYTNFGSKEITFFSSPGRTEICGNHTDHNNGKVVAASINLDSIAAAKKNNSNRVTIISEGFKTPFDVNLDNLNIIDSEKETTNALIRGIASAFVKSGYNIGGFQACITSNVLQGSGLSSSASIEVLIAFIFNVFFNEGKISPERIAEISQFAENQYFGKPCGLMDQMACSVGNIIAIDFKDTNSAKVTPLDFDFSSTNYQLVVIDTGGNHTDLTEDYASIPKDMKSVANYFQKNNCREINEQDFFKKLKYLKENFSHRAILRVLHFFNENKRVDILTDSLNKKDFKSFLNIIKESGTSSFKYLQNCYTIKNPEEQGVSLALALVDNYLSKIQDGACRVHGGGFAGTIQVFLPIKELDTFIDIHASIFGKEAIRVLNIRPFGAVEVTF